MCGLQCPHIQYFDGPVSVKACQTCGSSSGGEDFVLVDELVGDLVDGGGLLLEDVEYCVFLLVCLSLCVFIIAFRELFVKLFLLFYTLFFYSLALRAR